MSIKLMAAAWELDIPSAEKMVLLCLCDFSSDHGVCWPSVATIAQKCSKSDRTVQGAIKWLRQEGYCDWDDTPNKPHKFELKADKICGTYPAESAPQKLPRRICAPQIMSNHPAESAPEPLRRTTKISSVANATSLATVPFPRPEWADVQVWADFLANRKSKRLSNTATAYKGFLADIARLTDDEWPPPRLLEHAVSKGWAGIYDPNERQNGNGHSKPTGRGLGVTARAALRAFPAEAPAREPG